MTKQAICTNCRHVMELGKMDPCSGCELDPVCGFYSIVKLDPVLGKNKFQVKIMCREHNKNGDCAFFEEKSLIKRLWCWIIKEDPI